MNKLNILLCCIVSAEKLARGVIFVTIVAPHLPSPPVPSLCVLLRMSATLEVLCSRVTSS